MYYFLHNCKIRPRTNEEDEQEKARKDTDVEKVNREEKVESRGNAKGVNEEGFVEVRNRKNHGRGNYFQQKKQMFRPKETQNKGKDNGKNIGQSNVENGKGKENEIVLV